MKSRRSIKTSQLLRVRETVRATVMKILARSWMMFFSIAIRNFSLGVDSSPLLLLVELFVFDAGLLVLLVLGHQIWKFDFSLVKRL